MMETNNIVRDATASLFARQEMGLVNVSDAEKLLIAVREEVSARIGLNHAAEVDSYSFLVGATMSTLLYEGEHKRQTGVFTDFLDFD